MLPQVIELLAEVGIEAEAGEVAASAAEKVLVRFWTFRFRYHSRNQDASPAQATCRAPAS
jgi:hypothetical protein